LIDKKALIGLALIVVLFSYIWPSLQKKAIEKPSPSFEYESLSGGSGSFIPPLKENQIIHFWATWCPVCKFEWSEYDFIEQKHSVLHIVGSSGSDSDVKTYLEKNGLKLSHQINDEAGYIQNLFGVKAYPSTIIVDREGVVRFFKVGKVRFSEIDSAISELK